MQQKNSDLGFFSGMADTMKKMMETSPVANPFDLQVIMEMQRKNMQAITEANQRALQGWQTLAQRQTEMVAEFTQNNAGAPSKNAEENIMQTTDRVKAACEKGMANSRELGEIIRQSGTEAAEVITRRAIASLSEIKNAANNKND